MSGQAATVITCIPTVEFCLVTVIIAAQMEQPGIKFIILDIFFFVHERKAPFAEKLFLKVIRMGLLLNISSSLHRVCGFLCSM